MSNNQATPPPPNDFLDFVSEILEKMIDSQAGQIEKISSVSANCTHGLSMLEDIQKQFRNGFRSEIKKHIDEKIKELKEKEINNVLCKLEAQDEILDSLTDKVDQAIEVKPAEVLEAVKSYRSIGFWAKVISAALVAVASISFAAAKLATSMEEADQKPDIQQIYDAVEDLTDIVEQHIAKDQSESEVGDNNDPR